MLANCLGKADKATNVEVLFYVDEDDPTLPRYRNAHTHAADIPKLDVMVGPAWGVGRAWNALANKSTGDILYMGNDDLRYETRGWETMLFEEAAKHKDNIFCAYGDDGINGEQHCAFPAVGRGWFEVLKYFTPEVFKFFRHDTWIFDIAKKVGCVSYLPELKLKHYHYTVTGGSDSTTERNRNAGQAGHDHAVWQATEEERARHATLLKDAKDKHYAIRLWNESK